MQLRPDEKQAAMWCHLASLCALVGIPFGHIVGPFIVWQSKKNQSAFVDEHGKESLNFQLSFLFYALAAVIALIVFSLPSSESAPRVLPPIRRVRDLLPLKYPICV